MTYTIYLPESSAFNKYKWYKEQGWEMKVKNEEI